MAVDRSIDAQPTKSFFIGMLTRDVELSRAIIDLVDNCLDGALRNRPDKNFQNLWVRLRITPEEFHISDNCGGIPVDVAQKYAFRFGRPEGMPQTLHSVGQFGIGMKRALFKLGSKFKIESTTENSRFVLEVDVDEWKKTNDWKFNFTELETNLTDVPADQIGTIITVSPLHPSVAQDFKLDFFLNRLRLEIAQAHHSSTEQGLIIDLNGIPVTSTPMTLLASDILKPVKYEAQFTQSDGVVDVKIYAGVSNRNPSSAGWYIYCNGRMILESDKNITTGWGEGSENTIPRYHNDYAMFRGLVYFDSDQAWLLPWNTTKTGVDMDSLIFRKVRSQMITLMAQVMPFMRAYVNERASEDKDSTPLEDAIRTAKPATIASVATSTVFLWPKNPPKKVVPTEGRIQYNKALEKIEKVKKALKVTTLREVGEKTFDYFYQEEVEE
jgi:hypothetical protein